jgi:hypothetical protein
MATLGYSSAELSGSPSDVGNGLWKASDGELLGQDSARKLLLESPTMMPLLTIPAHPAASYSASRDASDLVEIERIGDSQSPFSRRDIVCGLEHDYEGPWTKKRCADIPPAYNSTVKEQWEAGNCHEMWPWLIDVWKQCYRNNGTDSFLGVSGTLMDALLSLVRPLLLEGNMGC